MRPPKISIITPSFNQGKYLEKTILSVLDQNYTNLEYIIIDGGSTDNSLEIIKKYSKHIVYWVSEKDDGQTQAINKGFKLATGDLISWMNSDDVYLKNSFKSIADKYNRYPDVDVFYADKININERGDFIRAFRYHPFDMNAFIYHKMSMCNQACFWKRSVFDKIGLLDETIKFVMDMEYFIRMGSNKGIKFKHFPEFWGAQRYYKDTKTSSPEWQEIWENEKTQVIDKYGLKRNPVNHLIYIAKKIAYYIRGNNILYLFNRKY